MRFTSSTAQYPNELSAIIAMYNGKRLTCSHWLPGQFVYLAQDGRFYDETGDPRGLACFFDDDGYWSFDVKDYIG